MCQMEILPIAGRALTHQYATSDASPCSHAEKMPSGSLDTCKVLNLFGEKREAVSNEAVGSAIHHAHRCGPSYGAANLPIA